MEQFINKNEKIKENYTYDVITVGSNTIDVFAYTDRSKSICIKTIEGERCFISYPVGSKFLIDELDFYTGGGGTNSAVSLSRMDLKVGYIGKIGNDENGNRIIEALKEEKVNFLGVKSKIPSKKTGYSIILDSLERQRTILAYKGVNDDLEYEEIDKENLKTNWFYFSSMVGKSFKTQEKLAEFANKNNIKILYNPSNYLTEKGSDYLENILKNTNILTLNDEEASLLVGKGSLKSMTKKLKSLGPDIVIITAGKNPVGCLDDKNIFYEVYPLKIKVVEATGAGDSFASSFLAGIIKTGDVEFSLKLAIVNSHSVLQYKGAKFKLLKFKEAKQKISKKDIIIEKEKL
ncbi:MAG: carbohydrate kinase family protein [Anaerolineales bacterium]|nr:carbohydrate kinase family protein [Anaerolineales bacterium]